jgi:hypothetical protein
MADLISIPGIGNTSLELLEAAGFHDAESLAKTGASELAQELARANSMLKITKRTPGESTIRKWIAAACDIVGIPEKTAEPAAIPVNYEQNPQVIAMLADAPLAIPLPARVLLAHQLGVADIPAAILLNCYTGDLDVRVEQRLAKHPPSKPAVVSNRYVRLANSGNSRLEIDTSKIRSGDQLAAPVVREVHDRPPPDRVALIRAPRPSTNEGRDPQSRWYIRGVLHNNTLAIILGAFATLLLMIIIPAAILSAALLLASVQAPEHFSWVPKGLLALPVILPVVGIFYLFFGLGGRCRICGQQLFVHRPHLKNTRAHRIPGLGYILPLCVHILLFRWFRCTHCGTPVRLKE